MINPKEIVSLKVKLLRYYADKEELTERLREIDQDYESKRQELLAKQESELKSLRENSENSVNQAFKAKEQEYLNQLEQLKKAKEDSIKKIEQKIIEAKEKYIKTHPQPFEPLNKFEETKSYIEGTIQSIPQSRVYENVSKPLFETMEDVYKFTDTLENVNQLETLKDVQTSHIEEKFGLVTKPIELLVDRLGEDKRMLVEIGYAVILCSFLGTYRQFVLLLITVPSALLMYVKFRNARLLKDYCSVYFQAEKYTPYIREKIESLMLEDYAPSLEEYKSKNLKKISVTYEREVAKLEKPSMGGPVQIDESEIKTRYTNELQLIDRELTDEKHNLDQSISELTGLISKSMVTMLGYSKECTSLLDTLDDNGTLPDYVHLGEVVNTRYGITYPYMYPTLKDSLCVTYDDYSREDGINFLKYYLAQLWRYVTPGYVKFYVIDTIDFGNAISDLTVQSNKLIEVITDESKIDEVMKDAVEELKKRNTTILRRYKSIEEYNSDMFAQDASLCPYRVYINLNPNIDHLLKPSHIALLKQASSCGILMINFMSNMIMQDLKPEKQAEALQMYAYHGLKITFENNTITQGLTLDEDESFTPIQVHKDKYVDFADKLYNKVESGGIKAYYYHDHRARNFPEMWSSIPTKDIELEPGNLNGEKDKPVKLLIGDSNPHALIAGTTGSGKSVLLNSIMMSVAHKYSPDWVQMLGLDFKGTELLFYGKPYALPHMRVVSATRDVDYVLSIFDDLVGEMEARNKLFDRVLGIKNYVEFCKGMQNPKTKEEFWRKIHDKTNKGLLNLLETPEGERLIKSMTRNGKYCVLPRILFIIDEFADMFLINDELKDKVTRAIKTLAKKARSAGIHMLFASQNMEGTVPEEVLEQFPLRICVPCSNNVSNALIGNPEAGKIVIGYAIANDKPSEKEKYNQFFKVAFEETPSLLDMIKEMHELGKTLGYTQPVPIYDEAEGYEYSVFRDKLGKYKKLYQSNTYILGEPRIYQRIDIPVTMSVTYKDRQNIAILAKSREVMDGMSVVFMDNYAKKDRLVYFQTADDEFLDKYDFSGVMTKSKRCEYSVEVQNLYDWLTQMLPHRQAQKKNGIEPEPIYVILHGINGMMSFGIDSYSDSVGDLLSEKMLDFNKVGIFFVLCSTSAKSMRQLFPHFIHILVGDLDERDVGYAPDVVSKAIRKISDNQMFYVNTDSNAIKSFKPYRVFKPTKVDETELFIS